MRSFRRALIVAWLPALGGATAAPLAAQDADEVVLQGTVVEARTHQPVPDATVLVMDSHGVRVAREATDGDGRFAAEVRRRAAVRLRVGATGYETVTTPLLHFGDDDHFVVEVLLDVDAVPLAPLEVVSASRRIERSPIFEGFDHRRERDFGSFFTRAEIEEIEPQRVSDLLRRLPGVELRGGGPGHRRTISMAPRTTPGRSCPVQIYLDGVLMTRTQAADVAVDDLVAPGDLEGMEVYRGLASVPAEFLNPDARCGVVALWTRRGGDG